MPSAAGLETFRLFYLQFEHLGWAEPASGSLEFILTHTHTHMSNDQNPGR